MATPKSEKGKKAISLTARMAERPACTLPIDDFCSDTDDFNSWVELFESAVKVAHPTADEAALEALNLMWLRLKLDDEARTIYGSATETEWINVKKELKMLLVNPEERYSWLARRSTIMWDGKESLHALATRVQRAVNKFDPDNPAKDREHFIRFRLSLPLEYKKAIDMNCGDTLTMCTIDEAKRIALRLQMANTDAAASAGVVDTTPVENSTSFKGASMSENRLREIETTIEFVGTRMDKFEKGKNKGSLRGYREFSPEQDRHNWREREDSPSPDRYDHRRDDRSANHRGKSYYRRHEDSDDEYESRGNRYHEREREFDRYSDENRPRDQFGALDLDYICNAIAEKKLRDGHR